MNDIYEIIGKILGAMLVVLLAYLTPHVKAWLKTHAEKSEIEALETIIKSLAQAAEQLWHDDDETGEVRMDYVKSQLVDLGYIINNEIISMIEGAVWKINNENKKARLFYDYDDSYDGSDFEYGEED